MNISKIEKLNREKGSVTVEAALVLPLFLFGLIALISIGSIMVFRLQLQLALYEEAHYLSLKCFDGHNEALSDTKNRVVEALSNNNRNFVFIEDGIEGIDFSDSHIENPEYIEIVANYNVYPVGGKLLGLFSIPVTQKSFVHVWCGYNQGYFDINSSDYVYVTNDSEVYHTNRECSHIKLSIKKVDSQEIKSLRNSNGAKYQKCEICKSSINNSPLYITSDGTKYHSDITCSGLKRVVRAVKRIYVVDKRPCSRCAKGSGK